MERSRIEWLTKRLLSGLADSREQEELFAWLREEKDDTVIREVMEEQWQFFESKEAALSEERNEKLFQSILDASKLLQEDEPAIVRPFFSWKRWTAAAAILLVLLTGGYFLLIKKPAKQDEIVKVQEPAKDVKAPETNRAMIKLADGRTVYLDSADNGELAVQGNIKLVKLANGQVAYQTASGEIIKELQYNTLSNPRGSKVIDMTLSDGSRVWLNAGSSVTYPIAFVGNERKVTITGEAYFEIAHDRSKPFKVSKDGTTIEVLGTHFNVNAYEDEKDIKVTLLEGSVRISADQKTVTIKPGQQGVVQPGGNISVNDGVDTDAVMAWKNGYFQFNRSGLPEVLRQLSRWYDVEINYEGAIPVRQFGGKINRDASLSQALKILEESEVRFRIEGKKLIVLP